MNVRGWILAKQVLPSAFNLIKHVFAEVTPASAASHISVLHFNWLGKKSAQYGFQRTRLSLSVLVSPQCRDGCLRGALNEPLIRLIRQQIESGDVFGLQVIPRAPLPLWSRCGTGQ